MTPLPSKVEHGRRVPRGQPVIALAMILAMWIAVRVTFIALEGGPAEDAERMARLSRPQRLAAPAPPKQGLVARDHSDPDYSNPDRTNPDRHFPGEHYARLATLGVPYVPRRSAQSAGRRPLALAMTDFAPLAESQQAGFPPWPVSGGQPPSANGSGIAPAWPAEENQPITGPRMTNLAPQEVPARAGSAPAGPSPAIEAPGKPAPRRVPRWSADGWLLLRTGDQAPALAAGAAAYGGSQAGAVLRYGFARANRLRPQAYLRVSAALGARVRQNEAALGLLVRPVRRLPVAVLGEWRLQEQGGLTRSRPVIMAVTEIAPLRLPFDVEAEVYAQGGWAGGRDATPFYDLAATFERRVVNPLPGAQLSAGGGVWSGGQRGAARLDVGPRMELRGMVGPSSRRIGVRVGVDWRFRVAGQARPGSGPALTVAAGF